MILKIEQFLDSRNLVFNYLTSLNRTSLIDADCLIKSTYNNVTAYIFIRKRKENSEYCICSFFVNPSMLYTGEKAYWWYKAKHHIWTINGFVYLTSVMDLFSRKIIAWTLSEILEVSCVIDTINNIVKTPEGAAVDNDGQLTSINAESYACMNMWGLTPEFMQILENGFKEFFANMGDKDILKAEYLLPTT